MLFLMWFVVLIAVLGIYLHKTYSRLSDYGVKHMKVVPLFGNLWRIILRLDGFSDDFDRNYQTFHEERFVGRYEFLKPVLMIRDLDLVKKVSIKDFESFIDHRSAADELVEPLFARNLITLTGQEWKDMRSTLSPAFTSSKIKLMVPFMEEVGEQMMTVLKNKIKESEDGNIEIDCKDLTSRYANDVIASCAFGLKVDSFTDENNKFYEMGKAISTFSFKQILNMMIISNFPTLAKKLKLTIFTNDTKEFFMNLVLNTMKDREERNIIRPDMINLLIEAKKGKLKHDDKEKQDRDTGFSTPEEYDIGKKPTDRVWSEPDLVAQAVLFFIAGFETISTAMSFALHELAVNPDVQDRLAMEIRHHYKINGGKVDFTSIHILTYMDMVTSEVLRIWPPTMALDRKCVKDYNLGRPNNKVAKDYIIRKGEVLAIPVWSLHRDPKYFENPYVFDPERFSDKNKHKIDPLTYMPFGIGPRNCIGSRFALCELKMLLYQILLHLEVSPSSRTRLPAKLLKQSLNLKLEGGHWLIFRSRS